jgi:hypothetical protein
MVLVLTSIRAIIVMTGAFSKKVITAYHAYLIVAHIGGRAI